MTDRDDTIAGTASGADGPVEVPRVEGSDNHWLTRPATIRKLWIGFSIVLAITVLLQAVVKVKGYFGIDSLFGFGAAAIIIGVAYWFGHSGIMARKDFYEEENKPIVVKKQKDTNNKYIIMPMKME